MVGQDGQDERRAIARPSPTGRVIYSLLVAQALLLVPSLTASTRIHPYVPLRMSNWQGDRLEIVSGVHQSQYQGSPYRSRA